MTSATGHHARLGHRGRRRTPVRTYLTGALGILLLFALLPSGSFADGSRTQYPDDASCPGDGSGSCRAAIDWSTSTYGPTASTIKRRTLFTVFLQAGEILETGSSAVGVGQGDIWVWSPGAIQDEQATTLPTPDFRCSTQRAVNGAPAAQGMITSRAQEIAGPQPADGSGTNPSGYIPCTFTAPATGLYNAAFIGPSGPNATSTSTGTGDIKLASANNFNTNQGTSTAAWDLSVRASAASTADITGRVFTHVLAAATGGNGRPLNSSIYATTLDGYVYKAALNGLDPYAFVIYGNERGFLDPQGNPLYHDVLGTTNAVSNVTGGTNFAPPQYPISFTPLSNATLNALNVTTTPSVPTLTNLAFNGSNAGSHVYRNRGGRFTFDTNQHGVYEVVISADGTDFDPGKNTNRVLRGVVDGGSQSVTWDGNDNLGNPFPVGTNYAVHAQMTSGVYHFPLIDAENSVKGGPSFTLTNPPNGVCGFGAGTCSTAFYDDRGYHTSVSDVGTPGSVLCGANPPATDHSGVSGYDSTGTQRKYGALTTASGNSCAGPFGDQKGLDTWTYYPSAQRTASFTVDPTPAAPTAADDSGTTPANTELVVGSNDPNGLLKNDTGSNITVTSHTAPANGSVTTTAAGGWDYTPNTDFSGTDTFGYTITDDDGQTATANVTVTVTPTAGNDHATTTAGKNAGTPTTIDVLANDHGSSLSVSTGSTSAHGGALVVNGNKITYTPAAGYSGRDTFPYTVTDASGQQTTATVTVDVTPQANNDAATTTAIAPVQLNVLTNDVVSTPATVTYGTPAHGSLTDNGGGNVTYSPDGTFSGNDTFSYQVTDPDGEKSTGTVTVTVSPVAVQDARNTLVNQPVTLNPTTNDKGSNKSFSTLGTPAHGTVTDNGNGTVTYTPKPNYAGTDSFTYTLNGDGGSDPSGVVSIVVKPAAPDDAYTTNAGQKLDVGSPGVLDNDTPGLTVVDHTNPTRGTLSIQPNGSFSYTPTDPDFSGKDTFTYTAASSDGTKADPATVTITVNPTAVSQNYNATDGQPLTVAKADGVLKGAHGTGLTVNPGTITTTAGGTVVMNQDGSFTYTPKDPFSGSDSFSYTVTDSNGLTTVQTSYVAVAPDAVADAALGRNGTTTTVPVLTNDHGSNLTVTAATNGTNGTVTVSPDGKTVSYTPTGDFSGTDTFTYTVTDASNQTDQATVTMTVQPHAVDDVTSTTAGTPTTVAVLANDHGTHPVVTVGTTSAKNGTLSTDGTTVTYTPPTGFSGTDTFPYTLTGDGGTDTATVTVTVKPQAQGDTGTVAANGTLTVPAKGVLGNDLGSGLTVTHTDFATTHGTLTLNTDGSYVYKPLAGYSGPDSFGYTATDSAGQDTHATVALTVTPTSPDDLYATDANTGLTEDAAHGVLSNDSGDQLTVTAHTDPQGTLVLQANGSFTYNPPTDFSGVDTFDYTATDSKGQDTKATARITVRPTSAADSYGAVGGTQLVVPKAQGVLANDHGTNLTATPGTIISTKNASVTMAADGSFTYTPPTNFSGPDTFTYAAKDASGQSYTQSVSVVVAPNAVDDTADVTAGTTTPTVVGVLGNDVGSGLTVSVPSATSTHGGTVSTNGTTVSYTPAAGFSGNDTFDYTVTDSSGASDTATVHVTVHPAATDDAVSTPIGTPVTVDELANDNVRTQTVTVTAPPGHGSSVVGSDNKITYSPAPGYSGKDTIGYTVTDPDGYTASATITVTVTPVAVDDTGVTTPVATPVTVKVLDNDQGTNLSVTSTTDGTNGTVTTNGTTVTYTPKAGFSGDDTFTYTASDGTSPSTATVKVSVLPTGGDDTGTTPVNTTLTVPAKGVLVNDAGSNLTAAQVTAPAHGTATLNSDGSYTYQPATDFSGSDSFTYKATDGTGRSVTQTVRLTVTPTVANDTGTTVSGTPLTRTAATGVLANDHGSLTASVPSGTTAKGGTVTMNADGSYTYTPKAGFSGAGANADSFTYSATDGTTTRTATVTLTVTPLATDDAGSTPHNTPKTVPAPGVLTNDSGTSLTVVGSSQPTHGSVTVTPAGGYTYTPVAGYSGPDAFTYTVQDSSNQQATATVRLSVGLAAVADTYGTPVDTNLSVDAASGLLANDSGSGVQLTGTSQPAHGTVSAKADGSFTFTPEANWSGNDSFTYTATDSSGGTATATVSLKVTPRAVDDAGTTSVGTPLRVAAAGGVLGNDRGKGLTVTGSTAVQHGTVAVAADGSYTYTPQAGYSGPDSFTYTATDQAGSTTTATVRITVTPTATDNAATTPADTPVTLRPVDDDHGTSLTLTSVTQPAHGRTSVVDGTVRFVPDGDWSGVTTCSYTTTDASGQTATAQLTIRVTPVAVPERVRTGLDTPVTLDSVRNDRGTSLTITSVTQPSPAQGRVAIRDGRLVFRPASGFVGTATFDYTVTDASGQTTTATDTVVVSPVAEADPDTATTPENQPVTVDPAANDTGHGSYVISTLQLRDPRTGVLTSTVHIPGQGTYHVQAATGKVTFTPAKGFHGKADPVTYQVADTAGVLHVSTIRVTVTSAGSAGSATTSTTGTTSSTGTTPTKGSDQGGFPGLPGTGGPFGPGLPLAGLALLVGGLVLLVRRRRGQGGERGSHRAR